MLEHSKDLILEDKRKALGYLMFLKEKRCGKIKGRGCAGGRKQRLYKAKEETSSPTVRIESRMLSCVIDDGMPIVLWTRLFMEG